MPPPAQWHVEVVYPKQLIPDHRWRNEGEAATACPWIGTYRAGNDGKRWDTRPHEATGWEETFIFMTREGAEKFAAYTNKQFAKWPDTCQGEKYVIRVLENDLQREVLYIDGLFGSNEPSHKGEDQ